MKRRRFIQSASVITGATLMSLTGRADHTDQNTESFMGVLGPIKDLGVTLVHEHVMADFIGAAGTGQHRYKVEEVVAKAKPFLLDLKKVGCNTFVDCTPVYLGRDARILKQLATETGMN